MSVELEEAKVQVAAFQKQCEEFLVVIVQQKREADEQQKVGLFYIIDEMKKQIYAHSKKPEFFLSLPFNRGFS